PDAEFAPSGNLCAALRRGFAGRDDLRDIDVLQPDERWVPFGNGCEAEQVSDSRDRGGPAQPLLLVDGLSKHFPVRGGLLHRRIATVQAVDDVSFSVRKGETLGIVGESGCGKSTTARLLMRLIQPDAGEVVFDGDPVGERHGISVNAMRRQMQMVFQDSYSSLNPRMTMAESIAYAPRMHGISAKAALERAHELL